MKAEKPYFISISYVGTDPQSSISNTAIGVFAGDEKGGKQKLYNRKKKAHDRYDDNGMGFSYGVIYGKRSRFYDSSARC